MNNTFANHDRNQRVHTVILRNNRPGCFMGVYTIPMLTGNKLAEFVQDFATDLSGALCGHAAKGVP